MALIILYLKLRLFDQTEFIDELSKVSMILGCEHKGIRKSEFVTKTQFLHQNFP